MSKSSHDKFIAPEFNAAAYQLWLEERAKEEKRKQKSRFFTISREFGCDGFATAIKVRDLLNQRHGSKWLVFTHVMIAKLAEDEQLGAPLIHKVAESRYSFMNWFIDGLVPDYLQSVQSQVFTRMRTLILNLAEKGNCIIVGGGAQIITADLDPAKFGGLHARLYSSHPNRVKAVMEKFKMEQEEAEKFLKENQHARNKFVEDFTGRTSADPNLYNIMLNNEKEDSAIMAETIYSLAQHMEFFK